jgi:glycosyltransferase involved in cell wall biosynthesis
MAICECRPPAAPGRNPWRCPEQPFEEQDIKILILNFRDIRHPQAGGCERYLYEIASRWVRDGHRSTWFASEFKDAPRRETIDGIDIIRAGSDRTVHFRAFCQYPRLRQHDVIVDSENGIPFFTRLYSRLPVVLLVHHIHTCVWYQEFSFHVATVGKLMESRLMPIVYRGANIVAVSDSTKQAVERLFGRSCATVIPCGISRQLRPGAKAERPEIVYLGRLKRYKCIDVLVRAMPHLRIPDVQLHIVGQGDDELRLQSLCRTLGLTNVSFAGNVPEHEKQRLLQRAWITVNPSSVEGWGLCNTEAHACGTPVVASDVPGNRDSVMDGQNGLLFQHNDVPDLVTKIEYLMTNPLARQQMSLNAVSWSQQFCWERAAAGFLQELEDAMSPNKKVVQHVTP